MSGQAGAIRHGIARALVQYDEEGRYERKQRWQEGSMSLRKVLRQGGHLTRDPREVVKVGNTRPAKERNTQR